MVNNITKLLIIRIFSLAAIVTLPSSCALNSSNEIQKSELTDLVKAHLLLFNDDGFQQLSNELCDNHIIFLGEVHRVPALIDAANRLVVSMACHRPVVYATEACYGLSYRWEPASLGEQIPGAEIFFASCIDQFNSGQPNEGKILMTAIDVEHSIATAKPEAAKLLYDLSSRSRSTAAKTDLDGEIKHLTGQNSAKDMSRYLKSLKSRFDGYLDTFSIKDQEEILFFVELLEVSNRYHKLSNARGIGDFILRSRGRDLREKYFIKTVERAYSKAMQRNSILLCRVGSAHITADEKRLGWYFKDSYPPTKGRVACVNMVRLYYEQDDPVSLKDGETSIDSIAKILMKDHKYGYLSLRSLQRSTGNCLDFSKHFHGDKVKYDGVLFVKVVKKVR